MPTPAINQAIRAPRTPVARPKVAGREKIPAPTMEPTTKEVRAARESFWGVEDVIADSLLRVLAA